MLQFELLAVDQKSRARRGRAKIRELEVNRLTIHRTPRHIYAQVIDDQNGRTLAQASSAEGDLSSRFEGSASSTAAARAVGETVAERAKAEGFNLTPLAFVLKAVVAALERFPKVNSSLDPDGEHLILKKYIHVGVAVDVGGVTERCRRCLRPGTRRDHGCRP